MLALLSLNNYWHLTFIKTSANCQGHCEIG